MNPPEWADKNVLVLGAGGMLGRELMAVLGRRMGDAADKGLIGWDIAELDIRNRDAVFDSVCRLQPSILINAAAYTDVDGCESNVEEARAVNATGPGDLAAACHKVGALLVHFGTDFIFDGRSDRPYRPDDPANPLSVYGQSKWEGEQAVRAAGCQHLIVRTSWLFGPFGHNFVEAILARAQQGEPLNVVSDQVGRPTLASDLAEAVVRLLDVGTRETVHFANAGQCSWFEFAQEIVRQADMSIPVQPISSEEMDRPARRPDYSVLDTSKYTELTSDQPAPWCDALSRYFRARVGETGTGLRADSVVPSDRERG